MKQTIPIVFVVWAALSTVVGTHIVCDRVARRLRLARHRRLTRRHKQILQRALSSDETTS